MRKCDTRQNDDSAFASRDSRTFFGATKGAAFFSPPIAPQIQRQSPPQGGKPVAPKQPAFPSIPAPSQPPTVALPGQSQAIAICGTWQSAPDRKAHSECVHHVQYVEALRLSRDNIRKVGTPYSATIADFYDQLLGAVALDKVPAPGVPVRYNYTNLTLKVAGGVTIPVPTFALVLEQDLTAGRSHGAVSGNVLTLNEMPPLSVRPQADIERTAYHELIHFIAAEIAQFNRNHQAAPGGAILAAVHPEFLAQSYAAYGADFTKAVAPVFERALQKYAPSVDQKRRPELATAYAGFKWLTWLDEMIARVEEAVYLARRDGRGFGQNDLDNLAQSWLHTSAYWSNLEVGQEDMGKHLAAEGSYIDQQVVPVVRRIQIEFLRRRP